MSIYCKSHIPLGMFKRLYKLGQDLSPNQFYCFHFKRRSSSIFLWDQGCVSNLIRNDRNLLQAPGYFMAFPQSWVKLIWVQIMVVPDQRTSVFFLTFSSVWIFWLKNNAVFITFNSISVHFHIPPLFFQSSNRNTIISAEIKLILSLITLVMLMKFLGGPGRMRTLLDMFLWSFHS